MAEGTMSEEDGIICLSREQSVNLKAIIDNRVASSELRTTRRITELEQQLAQRLTYIEKIVELLYVIAKEERPSLIEVLHQRKEQ